LVGVLLMLVVLHAPQSPSYPHLCCFYWGLWLAEDRLHYTFSLMSLIDAVTIIPAFVLYRTELRLV
jgi:hypothetical protein